MIVFGYAKGVYYDDRGVVQIKVRIPDIHGAYNQKDYKGQQIKNYVLDENLPKYPTLHLPKLPSEGDVVALSSMDDGGSDFIVIGVTGGSYNDGVTGEFGEMSPIKRK